MPASVQTRAYLTLTMRSSDWPFSLYEMWSLIRFLPLHHPMVYNKLCRVFNECLGTDIPAKEPLRFWKKRIRELEVDSFLDGMKRSVDSIRLQANSDEEKAAAVDYVVAVVREAYRANFHERTMATMWQPEKKKKKRELPAVLFPPRYFVDGIEHRTENSSYDASLPHTGEITPTYECRWSQFFPHVKTDGVHWIDIASGTRMYRVADYRVATIYELLRLFKYDPHEE